MKKFVNDPAKFVPEMLEGIFLANEGKLKYEPKYNLIYRADRPSKNHVSVIQGSGSGHEPAHVMTVGRGMLDALIPIRDLGCALQHVARVHVRLAGVLVHDVANEAIDRTKGLVAKRGRQQFVGDRSIGTPDPGIVAIATMMNDLCTQFGVARPTSSQSKN